MFGNKKAKKPLSKGRRILRRIFRVIGCILLLVLIVAAVTLGPTGFRYAYLFLNTGYTPVNTTLTTEQKLKDLDYMYDIACLQNPKKELFEQAYGISYDDVYKKYRDLVINSKSEFEYLSYMTCFISDLPGKHNIMKLPDYEKNSQDSSFALNDVYGTKDIKDYTYSWTEDFRDDVKKYTEYKAILFTYIDGKYIAATPSSSIQNAVTDYVGGQIVSLNGKDPKEMCFDFFERYTPTYDSGNKCYFRSNLVFNNTTGVKYNAEILMPDGKVVNVDLYDDPAFDLVLLEAAKTYPELNTAPKEENQEKENKVTDVMDENYVPTTYRIYKDESRRLIYLNTNSCDASEGRRLAVDLQKALDEVNAETVILDLRQNGGGSTSYANEQLLPVLFSHDVDFHPRYVGKYNNYTKRFKSIITRFFLADKGKIDVEDGNFYYGENFSVKGKATRKYKIYVLTSQKTFSTADIVTALCKQYEDAVIVGTNTAGEGISGAPVNCVLPESRFGFVYVPTVNVECPENAFNGIEPDIYIARTVDEYMDLLEMEKKGVSSGSYESRQTWDRALIKVLNIVDGKEKI